MHGQFFGGSPTRDFASFYERRGRSAERRIDAIINGFTQN
jgi:hypothetical protein